MITISGVTVRYGGVVALDDICATIADDVVGIIGPNGAGKTTLINVMSGFVTPDRGSVEVDGQDLLRLKPHQRARWGLARCFQKLQTPPDLTVREQVHVVLDHIPLRSQDRNETIARALAYVGLDGQAGVAGAELNAFQQRMLEIARCVAAAPRILLLDEPGGGMSETESRRLRAVIAGIRSNFGAQVLLIDHDVELIKAMCSRTMVLDFGKLIAFGPTDRVLRDDKVQAAYLGEGSGK